MSGKRHLFGPDKSAVRMRVRSSDFALPSEPGNEWEAMELVAEAVRDLSLPRACLERLKTAVADERHRGFQVPDIRSAGGAYPGFVCCLS